MTPQPTRRGLLTLGAGAAAGAALTACGSSSGARTAAEDTATVPFHGTHQAGIATDQQDRMVFTAYDLTVSGSVAQNRAALVTLLRTWTAAAAAMTTGSRVPGESDLAAAPPADTGEAVGLPAASLTLTIGFGPSLFDDRFGLAGRRPAALADLPHLAPENLDPARSNGDLSIQACADDPQVAFHAVRNLARLGRDSAVTRWVQLGFGRASSTGSGQVTPRNLLGFKDGTRNILSNDSDTMNRYVWVGAETDQPWMRGGSYQVVRRISQKIEAWDRDFLGDQENVFGRAKYTGAPLTGTKEFDRPDFAAVRGGVPVIPHGAHIRLAARENNGGVQILRRGYNYTDGILPNGELDAGLFFVAFQQDPRTQFVALQRKLGAGDKLNEYIQHVASGLFACPPGPARGEYWGARLFA
jgi:deferrochelatase/peroxidase EfeB